MKKERVENSLEEEFERFMTATPVPPPRNASREILSTVRRELTRRPFVVLLKLSIVAFLVGMLILTFRVNLGPYLLRSFGFLKASRAASSGFSTE